MRGKRAEEERHEREERKEGNGEERGKRKKDRKIQRRGKEKTLGENWGSKLEGGSDKQFKSTANYKRWF